MNVRALAIAAALGLLAAACSKDDEGHTPQAPPPTIAVTASPRSLVANGASFATISVTDTSGGPVTVTTTKGAFRGGGQTATVTGAAGSVELVACDAAADSACPGNAVVTATSAASGSTSTSVTFATLATACLTNCRADAGCASLACNLAGGGTGACSATAASSCLASTTCTPSPGGSTSETSCTDQIDNDCNGAVDCADALCSAAAACAASTSGIALKLTPGRARLPADGVAATAVVAEVTSDGQPSVGAAVNFTTNLGTLSAAAGTTGPDGKVSVTFTAAATAGDATITASLTSPAISRQATITLPRLGSFRLPEAAVELPVMGAAGSGFNEIGAVQVQVLDDQGLPYPDGLVVRFEHHVLGGSTLRPPLATTGLGACTLAAGCVAHDAAVSSGGGAANSAGLATAWLQSGTVAGTLSVSARTTAGGATRTVALPTATVIGAKAGGANFSVVCSPRNVPALAETDCAISLVDAPITCAAILKDRYNNLLGTPTHVVFASEAAAVGQIATTPEYDPGADPTGQADLGTATQIFNTLGAGLPFDVAPDAASGERSASHGLDGCGPRTHNPRDGVVTIVAIADGEEAFFDANGNGAYDTDEPFVDQGEPFLDQDDDGLHDDGEWFLDVDGDLGYTGGNLGWDASTKVWTQTIVVYTTGAASALPAPPPAPAGTFLGSRWAGPGVFDACTPTPPATPFAVTSKVAGPPAVAATTQTYTVVASDMNLNFLTPASSYGVSVEEGANVKAEYLGLASYADLTGLFYRYWPCDKAGNCASQCRAAPADLPCVMRPAVTSYSCGVDATVTIRGGDSPDGGTVGIDWDVQVPWNVFGAGRLDLSTATLRGTNLAPP